MTVLTNINCQPKGGRGAKEECNNQGERMWGTRSRPVRPCFFNSEGEGEREVPVENWGNWDGR